MTDQEKEQILTLRGQGKSYNSIATALHLSVNSIKTFCYRSRNRKALKLSSKNTCGGQSGYKAEKLNAAVIDEIKKFLGQIQGVPREDMVEVSCARSAETYKTAYRQAEKEFENSQNQVAALEEEAVKALTGESQLDLSVVNSMLLKHRARLEAAQQDMFSFLHPVQ